MPSAKASVQGIDVSAYQPRVDWARWRRQGIRFAWIKATEGATWRSPTFVAQRTGARAAGLLQGAYHYARPRSSTGAVQARFFVRHGGGWTADGRTLPGALDLEKNPSGAACYGLSTRAMVGWIRDFTTEYRRLTGRDAVIYVQAGWWRECTGGERSFASSNPLWLYDHDGPLGPLPPGWERATAWQYGVRESMDRNVFLGSEADLQRWARTA
jgi:GH25 family lysozyme M1 (1,4-beta-N-acetylmuramidase)